MLCHWWKQLDLANGIWMLSILSPQKHLVAFNVERSTAVHSAVNTASYKRTDKREVLGDGTNGSITRWLKEAHAKGNEADNDFAAVCPQS